ncbi:MAG: DUF86 domain-containing protein [Firmicutes bacterium]|nr:DUF86 domain-containing protein [Bacillota bacterium]
MVNKMLIEQRLSFILECYNQLIGFAEKTREEFLADKTLIAATESYLRRILESIFDIGRHILAKSGRVDLAQEYKGIAKGLGELKVVDQDLSEKLVQMAGYRNRLVHLYNLVTDEELYHIIKNDLGDIRDFIKSVSDYVAIHNLK